MTAKFAHDLKGLLTVGLFYCYAFFGVTLFLFYFNSQYYSSLYYLPLKIVGTLLGYGLVSHVAPGGSVNLSLTYRVQNKEEKETDLLIRKYRNKYVVTGASLLFLLGTIYYDLRMSVLTQITVFDSVVVFFFYIIVTIMLGQGLKSLTAWWNIKKHWQKELRP
jgi:hypothetical protein